MRSKKNRKSGIYCYRNMVNGKNYVGQSVDLCTRKKQFEKNKLYSGKLFQNAINKYGKENFQYSVLKYCKPEELNYWEQYYISILNTTDRKFGYNCTSGGDSQYFRTEECKKNMRESWTEERRKKQSERVSGEKNGNYGKKWNEEQKKQGSKIAKEHCRKRFFEKNGFDDSKLETKVKEYISITENITIEKIAKHFNISTRRASTICNKFGLTTEMFQSAATERQKKPVVQCDIDNHDIILNIFPSLSEAEQMTGMQSIKHCVYGKQSHAYGYFWRFANEGETPSESLNENYFKPTKFFRKMGKELKQKLKEEGRWKYPSLYKKVYCYDNKGNLIKIYDSVASVEKDGFCKSQVSNCCTGISKGRTCKNHFFSYCEKTKEEVLNAFVKHSKKPVVQMTKEGVFIREWDSATEAAKYLGLSTSTNISCCCCYGRQKTAAGYKWMFKKDYKCSETSSL